MGKVTADLIKQLRERTGVGMSKCKAALTEADGNLEKAIENLRKAGMASAVKKEGRQANEGLIGFFEADDVVSIVEVNSETDFVAQNEKFKVFLSQTAEQIAKTKPTSLEKFLGQTCSQDTSVTNDQYRALIVQGLGENIQIKRLTLLNKGKDRSIGIYSHMGGKIVCAIVLKGKDGLEALARDIAMHIAAESPDYLSPSDVPNELQERERDIAKEQVKGKPEKIIDKIIEGKLRAFFDQVCLLKQKYVKDNSMTIEQLLAKESKSAGTTLQIESFLRWQVGA